MDRLRRRLSRRPTSRAGVRRARVRALALLAVTAALAVLLAVLSHQAWPPVLVSIVGTVPALYVAWLAVPGVISPPEPAKKLAYGRPTTQWNPVELGVHQVIGGGPMPTYIRRPHDELLRTVLDPAVPASRLVVVRGRSSTGKTRAAYEAVADRLADWQLDYPLNVAALKERLDAGIPARTVLWLGELRQYADADADGGPAMLGRLADLLQGEGHLIITSMWPEQWNTYTTAARAGPGPADPAGTAGRLLTPLPKITGSDPARIDPARGGVIDVPERFTAAEMTAAARAGDPVLTEAAEAAARSRLGEQGGQVTQYLAGVPDLLDRYDGDGGDPYGQAVITAAMDATRLGHASPLPAALLQEATIGYLTDPQRTEDIASWRDTAVAWATAKLKGAVQALQPVPPPAGAGVVGYQVADYLDQHGRRTRQDQLGPASLWDALAERATSANDLTRLGQAARDRGLYRHAAALWTRAANQGSTDAAGQLITHLRRVSPGDTTRAARWVASRVSLDNLQDVAELLRALREAGASDAARTLAARWAADHASLDSLPARLALLWKLDDAVDSDAARTLAAWAVGHASLGDPEDVAELLSELRFGPPKALAALFSELPDPLVRARPDIREVIASMLLKVVREAKDPAAARALLDRELASLDNLEALTELLAKLHAARDRDADRVRLLAKARDASLDSPWRVAELLKALRAAGADDAVQALLARDPASHVRLDAPWRVAELLKALRAAGADDAVQALLARDPASHVRLDDPGDVAELLKALRAAGARGAVTTLANRAANAGMFDLFREFCLREASSYQFGREPDGTPPRSWRWQEPGRLRPWSGTVEETAPAGLIDTPALQHVFQHLPGRDRSAQPTEVDHVENRTFDLQHGERTLESTQMALHSGSLSPAEGLASRPPARSRVLILSSTRSTWSRHNQPRLCLQEAPAPPPRRPARIAPAGWRWRRPRVPPQADPDRSFVLDDVGLALTRQRRGVVSGRRM